MSDIFAAFAKSKRFETHDRNVYVHGTSEPVLSILDAQGFEVQDLVLMGFNDNCGHIILPDESRARNAAELLELAYATKVGWDERLGAWEVTFDLRARDGSELSNLVTGLKLKDGRVLIRDGRWVG